MFHLTFHMDNGSKIEVDSIEGGFNYDMKTNHLYYRQSPDAMTTMKPDAIRMERVLAITWWESTERE